MKKRKEGVQMMALNGSALYLLLHGKKRFDMSWDLSCTFMDLGCFL